MYARVRAHMKRFHYDYMVLDEGHSIKNIKSSRFQRLRIVNAKHRLLLRYCSRGGKGAGLMIPRLLRQL